MDFFGRLESRKPLEDWFTKWYCFGESESRYKYEIFFNILPLMFPFCWPQGPEMNGSTI